MDFKKITTGLTAFIIAIALFGRLTPKLTPMMKSGKRLLSILSLKVAQ